MRTGISYAAYGPYDMDLNQIFKGKIGKFNFENSVSNRNEKIAQACNFINNRRTDWDHLPYFNEELGLEKIDAFKEERIIKEDEEILILLGQGSSNLIILELNIVCGSLIRK